MWQPTTLASDGPAQPCGTLRASPGECDLKSNPTQAHGTSSKARSYFYPWERLTTERPNTIELARCKVSYQPFSHNSMEPAKAKREGHASPDSSRELSGSGPVTILHTITMSQHTVVVGRPAWRRLRRRSGEPVSNGMTQRRIGSPIFGITADLRRRISGICDVFSDTYSAEQPSISPVALVALVTLVALATPHGVVRGDAPGMSRT